MVIFHSYVSLPEAIMIGLGTARIEAVIRIFRDFCCLNLGLDGIVLTYEYE